MVYDPSETCEGFGGQPLKREAQSCEGDKNATDAVAEADNVDGGAVGE